MSAKKSCKQLSKEYMEMQGWSVTDVERHIQAGSRHVTFDAFHIGDLLAYHVTKGIALVQATSYSNFGHHKYKVQSSMDSEGWKRAGGQIFLHGWGGKKGLREEQL